MPSSCTSTVVLLTMPPSFTAAFTTGESCVACWQMNRLYQLHLQNTELPAKYSTLLQLREMLAIKEGDADVLEQEVLGSGSSFSI